MSEFLNSTIQSQHADDHDGQFVNEITNYAVNIDGQTFRTVERINGFFPEFKINIIQKAEFTYEISVMTELSMYALLNFAVTYFSIIAMLNDTDLDINDGLVDKLIRCLNVINADYYIRYIVNSRVLTNKKLYDKFKPLLEKPNMTLLFGNTAVHRRTQIRELLQFDRSIIDIGCGEGFYAIPFAEKLLKSDGSLTYFGIDINEDELAVVKRKAKDKELTNIVLLNSHEMLSAYVDSSVSCDVIITEVIEHMAKEQSQEIIRWILNNVNFNKIVITTPNADFNKFYHLVGKMRHDDHKWELTADEFDRYISEVLGGYDGFNLVRLRVGDVVDGISCSNGLLIQKKN
jgi:2-polyprenyl-3-methyl-5-hydroxy-6-metoxy-1,4-benzoquinol methylase